VAAWVELLTPRTTDVDLMLEKVAAAVELVAVSEVTPVEFTIETVPAPVNATLTFSTLVRVGA
jgi:hypothetical protein